MKMLLWKDYRHNRRLLVAAGILLSIPYVVIVFGILFDALTSDQSLEGWINPIGGASMACMVISLFLGAFVAGNAIAGERGDRAAEFARYLPIPRQSALASKAVLAIGCCLIFWLANGIVLLIVGPWMDDDMLHHVAELAGLAIPAAVLAFGASWLLSSLLSNPAVATLSGLGSVIVFIPGLIMILKSGGLTERAILNTYLGSCPALGVLCFVIGAVYYLRRVEP